MTKLIVGLGNPGPQYEGTRHNIGFTVLDQLAQHWGITHFKEKFKGQYAEFFNQQEEKILLVKPQTFMNLSGECVAPWIKFLKIPSENILIVHDELDFPLGKLKQQWAAGPGGHNGVKSIQQHLGHKNFHRLRIGIGHPGRADRVTPYVLSPFSKQEQSKLDEVLQLSQNKVEEFLN